MERFNSAMLVLARESRGLTQAELATMLSIGQGTLSKYESRLLDPMQSFVQAFSEALSYPISFFYRQTRIFGFPPFHFRKRKKLSAKALGKIIAEMNIRRLHIERMAVAFGPRGNAYIPEVNVDDYHSGKRGRLDIEDVARNIRERWMVPPGPIANMMTLLEENGAVIISCDFGTDLLDAMSQRVDGLPVLFFINANAPADRIRHTLAHELGHMILHTTEFKDDGTMEDEADAFAGAFLLPADQVRPQLRNFDLRQLANMKNYWKVSMAAIAVRAHRLKLITEHQSRMFWMEMSRLGYRKSEPNEPPREEPKALREMVAFHRKKLGYSTEEMATLLDLTVPEYERMYASILVPAENSGRHLRLVK